MKRHGLLVFLCIILCLATVPAVSGTMPAPSFLQDSRSLLSFPSFDSPRDISPTSIPFAGPVIVKNTKPASTQFTSYLHVTRLPMGISLDSLHRNIGLGLQKSTSDPDACWIPIDPVGPIRIPMAVAYINGYYCDTPWIPHVYIPG